MRTDGAPRPFGQAGAETPPRVTVCVVTYNQADYIEQCLRSVLAQEGWFDLEVLVGDDQSADATRAIAENIAGQSQSRVRVLPAPIRLGGIGNLRRLIREATGQFIAHLDGDDFWLPGKLSRQLAHLSEHPHAVAAYCNALLVSAEGGEQGRFTNARSGLIDLSRLVERGNFLNHSSLLYRSRMRSALLELPGDALDYQMHIALALHGDLVYSAEPAVGYRFNAPGSVIARDNEGVRRRYWQALASIPEGALAPRSRRLMCADFLRRVAFRSLKTRDMGLFRSWWPRVRVVAGCKPLALVASTMANLLAEAIRQTSQWLRMHMGLGRGRVLYFR